MVTNSTHKADLKSWVEAANEPMCSFSIQNLPYGVFNSNENLEKRIGVAIGDHVLPTPTTCLLVVSSQFHWDRHESFLPS